MTPRILSRVVDLSDEELCRIALLDDEDPRAMLRLLLRTREQARVDRVRRLERKGYKFLVGSRD